MRIEELLNTLSDPNKNTLEKITLVANYFKETQIKYESACAVIADLTGKSQEEVEAMCDALYREAQEKFGGKNGLDFDIKVISGDEAKELAKKFPDDVHVEGVKLGIDDLRKIISAGGPVEDKSDPFTRIKDKLNKLH